MRQYECLDLRIVNNVDEPPPRARSRGPAIVGSGIIIPRLGIEVLELDLMARNGVALAIEDEETGRCGALVNAADKPMVLLFVFRFRDAFRQMFLVGPVRDGRKIG